jgi:hypothetical protein
MDLGDSVSDMYEAPYPFTGKILSVAIELTKQPARSAEHESMAPRTDARCGPWDRIAVENKKPTGCYLPPSLPFNLTIRVYRPEQAILDGKYKLPPVRCQ